MSSMLPGALAGCIAACGLWGQYRRYDEVADCVPVDESDGKTQIGEFAINGLR